MTTKIENQEHFNAVFSLIENAQSRIVIVAPYIKSSVLNKLKPFVPRTVVEFICVTRWLPTDIANGVCDIEIFDDISEINGSKLLINPLLHAKFYSNDNTVLTGSSNMTQRGLGLCDPSNFELLISLPRSTQGLIEWENSLINSAVPVTEKLRDKIYEASKLNSTDSEIFCIQEVEITDNREAKHWFPSCNAPDRLWDVYSGRGLDDMISSAYQTAINDLKYLSVPSGFNRNQFETYLRVLIKQMSVFVIIDKLSISGVRDDTVQQILLEHSEMFSFDVDPEQSWKILQNWLLHFFPEDYMVEGVEFLFRKGRKDSSV